VSTCQLGATAAADTVSHSSFKWPRRCASYVIDHTYHSFAGVGYHALLLSTAIAGGGSIALPVVYVDISSRLPGNVAKYAGEWRFVKPTKRLRSNEKI